MGTEPFGSRCTERVPDSEVSLAESRYDIRRLTSWAGLLAFVGIAYLAGVAMGFGMVGRRSTEQGTITFNMSIRGLRFFQV